LDLFNLSGRVAIVTGGARGIGFAIAQGLASSGAHVFVADINTVGAEEAGKKMGVQARAIGVDVTERNSVQDMVTRTMKECGQIDVLVNCAGIIVRKPIEEVSDAEWDSVMDVNLRGVFLCSQVVGREMIKTKGGKIINISSNIAQVLQPGRGVYAVSKPGVSHLT